MGPNRNGLEPRRPVRARTSAADSILLRRPSDLARIPAPPPCDARVNLLPGLFHLTNTALGRQVAIRTLKNLLAIGTFYTRRERWATALQSNPQIP